jgi:gluconokinase
VRETLRVVVMGVAGCGKSEVGALLADLLGAPLIEGDSFHPPANVAKMRDGVPLTDEDRAGWLATLGEQLALRDMAVLTCSALKKSYRDQLRAAAPGVRFVFLQIGESVAQARVTARPGHFYPASLVSSQFATLQDPSAEAGVLTLDATLAPQRLAQSAADWLRRETAVQGFSHAH